MTKEEERVASAEKVMAVGACAGAAVGAAVAAATVPVVQAAGFTAAGIAAESAAAGMMSAAATASVAVLQSIGATGAVPLGIAAAPVAVLGAVGLGVAGIVNTCRSFQHEYVSAYDPRDPADRGQYWLIATEEGWGNVRVCRYSSECKARDAFDKIWCSRILYNPDGSEVQCAGANGWAISTVRRVMAEHYLSG